MIAIRLPKEIELRLNALAASTGRTKSYYIREALLTHLTKLETVYLAEKRLQHARAGATTTPAKSTQKRRALK